MNLTVLQWTNMFTRRFYYVIIGYPANYAACSNDIARSLRVVRSPIGKP